MVYFNCNACGEALKKNQVEKHTYKCRQCQVLSCVDCSKDFWGDDYQTHTKCMTEDQKYCGKDYVAKVNKGEVKQEKWIEKVQHAIEQSTSDPKLKGLLERLQDYPNIPRKKAKFENFLKNSMRVLSPFLITKVWDLLMEQTAKVDSSETPETKTTESSPGDTTDTNKTNNTDKADDVNNTDENGQGAKLSKREKKEDRQKKNKKEKKDKPVLEGSDENVKKSKKRKRHDSEDNDDEENEPIKKNKKKKKKQEKTIDQCVEDKVDISKVDGRLNDTLVSESPKQNGSFKWGATILALLEKKGEISYKKLRRKILQEFAAQDGSHFKEDSLQIKFDKKLNKLPQIVITDGRVLLK